MFINRNELNGLLAKNNIPKNVIAKNLGITYNSFYRKMVCEREFNENEIKYLYVLFGDAIFFK